MNEIEQTLNTDNESTRSPYWLIPDLQMSEIKNGKNNAPSICPDCSGNVIYYHSGKPDYTTRTVCKEKCSDWKIINEFKNGKSIEKMIMEKIK